MKNFTLDIGPDGVAIARFDVPGRPMNTITLDVQNDLDELANAVASDENIVGLVIQSAKSSGFCAGADLVEMEGAIERWRLAHSQDELREGVESAGQYSQRLRSLETVGKPIAIILAGVALGGGLELALAGHYRIATGDAAKLRLGLPEVTIGLMPGAGATQRLPRLMGLERSTAYLTAGKPLELEAALQTGVVHEHVADPDQALDRAKHWVIANPNAAAPWDAKGYRVASGPHTPAGYAKFPMFIAQAVGDGPGDHAARANILRAIYEGAMVPIDAGLRIESRYFFNTVRTKSSAAMVRTMFHARKALAKSERRDPSPYVARIRQAWNDEIEKMVRDGESERFVRGVARSLAPRLTAPISAFDPVSVHPTDTHQVARITERLLRASSQEAATCLFDGLVGSASEGDLVAIEAGYPSFTGGPISYLESVGPENGAPRRVSIE